MTRIDARNCECCNDVLQDWIHNWSERGIVGGVEMIRDDDFKHELLCFPYTLITMALCSLSASCPIQGHAKAAHTKNC
jgi:hypothetical protein